MISEPEMVDEFGVVGAGEVVGDFDRSPVAGPRPRRPWLWALGGAVLASALWAGALYVHPVGAPEPDLHGYRLDGDTCPAVRLKAIGAAIASREDTPRIEPELLNDPALDRAKCYISLRSPAAKKPIRSRWHTEYSVGVTVTLHKRTDPAVEFEAMRATTDSGTDVDAKVEKVPNLGDSAYLLTQDDGIAELRVREGGAVLSLSLASYTQFDSEDGEAPPDEAPDVSDLSPYQSAMISDMRDLMKGLKR